MVDSEEAPRRSRSLVDRLVIRREPAFDGSGDEVAQIVDASDATAAVRELGALRDPGAVEALRLC